MAIIRCVSGVVWSFVAIATMSLIGGRANAQCDRCTGTIDFEGLNEATAIGSQYATAHGVTFGIVGSTTASPRIVVSGASQLGFVGPG